MIKSTDAVRIAMFVVAIMAIIACCRLLSYADRGEIEQLNENTTWLLLPSLGETRDARYVNAFATDEDELQALDIDGRMR